MADATDNEHGDHSAAETNNEGANPVIKVHVTGAVIEELCDGEDLATNLVPDSRCQRAKQLLKDGDFLTAGQLLRSAANDGNGEACAIIGEILEQQNQHAAAANLLKVGYLFV